MYIQIITFDSWVPYGSTLNSLFREPFLDLAIKGILH